LQQQSKSDSWSDVSQITQQLHPHVFAFVAPDSNDKPDFRGCTGCRLLLRDSQAYFEFINAHNYFLDLQNSTPPDNIRIKSKQTIKMRRSLQNTNPENKNEQNKKKKITKRGRS
jgi:hypothetical protein